MKTIILLTSLFIGANVFAMPKRPGGTPLVKVAEGNWASNSAPYGVDVDKDGMLSIRSGCGGGSADDVAYMSDDKNFQVGITTAIGGWMPESMGSRPSIIAATLLDNGNLKVKEVSVYFDDQTAKWKTVVRNYNLIRDLHINYPMCAMAK